MNFAFYLGTHWRNGSSWISLYLFVKHISWQSFVNSLLGLIKTIDNYKIIQKQWKPNWPLYIKLLVLLSCVNQRTGELDPSLESFWDCNLFSSLLLNLVYKWFITMILIVFCNWSPGFRSRRLQAPGFQLLIGSHPLKLAFIGGCRELVNFLF